MLDFFPGHAGFQGIASGGVDRTFMPECYGHRQLYQPAALLIERAVVMASFAQLGKSSPNCRVFLFEG